MSLKQVIGCDYCDLLVAQQQLHGSRRYKAVCPRCGSSLYAVNGNTLSLSLSFIVTGCFLIIPAFTTPIFILTTMNNVRTNIMFTGVMELFIQGLWDIALLVLFTAIVFPILKMVLLFYTLVGIHSGRLLPATGSVFRWYHYLHEWAMVDVFVLGAMVTLTKLDSFADVSLGLGFWSLCVMLTLSTLAHLVLNIDMAWQEIERLA